MSEAPNLASDSVVTLAKGVRLQHDRVRDRWVLLGPERTLALDAIGVAIIKALDGERSLGELAAYLAQTYDAPEKTIRSDVERFLTELSDRRLLQAG